MSWQRSNIQAAAAYLRDRLAAGATDAKTKSVYEGLLEVLDPNRRTARLQRELAESAKAAVAVRIANERRAIPDRRRQGERRKKNLGPPGAIERRTGKDRRSGRDRRRNNR